MKDRIGFSMVLRGQLAVKSEAGTKWEVVLAEDSPGSSGCATDVSIPVWSQSIRAFVHHREKALPSLVTYLLSQGHMTNHRILGAYNSCVHNHTSSEIEM